MKTNQFQWDEKKAASNLQKHGVSFWRAVQVFDDSLALTVFDTEHSDKEERWYTMGLDHGENVLVVHHTYRHEKGGKAIIRVISARKPTRKERAQYSEEEP